MNRPTPFSNPPPFTFLPQNPYPSFSPLLLQNPSPATTDLASTFSAVEDLIRVAETTISSLSPALPRPTIQNDVVFCRCPFNPHHRVLPESLFRHFLRCPSSCRPIDPCALLGSLRYPKTLCSDAELRRQKRFRQNLPDFDAELCFSLDDYFDSSANFFYHDCPGVVSSSDQDSSAKKTFTLPRILAAECANFIGSGGKEFGGFRGESSRLLPSELWAVRDEIGLWSDYPSIYSYAVLQTILWTGSACDIGLLTWVISNSPLYGIVIDVPMGDHIFLLFRLCLKAIVKEATASADLLINRDLEGQDLELNVKTKSFKCRSLVEVLMWFTLQLSVLYGKVNAKLLSINLLKHFLLKAASGLLLFSSEQYSIECAAIKEEFQGTNDDAKLEVPPEKIAEHQPNSVGESVCKREIFVSQIAASIAALHERSLLEEKIKELWFSPLPTKYQLMAEHAYMSKRADEERQKRFNYRPLLEHDGFLLQRSQNQETSKTKTREELLAEERDYKRRRMSYRGKKLKRTTTQVMRDIIEEYMEEIKQAGGIGCFVKGAEKEGKLPSEQFSAREITTDVEQDKRVHGSSEANFGYQHGYRKQSHSDYVFESTRLEDASPKDYDEYKRNSCELDERLENNRSITRDRHDRRYHSKISEREKSHGRQHKRSRYQRERDDEEVTRTKYHDNRSFSAISYSMSNSTMRKDNRKSETKDRWQRNVYRDNRPNSTVQNAFDDRYDPSESLDMYEENVSTGGNYV